MMKPERENRSAAALGKLFEEYCDYMLINHLGDPATSYRDRRWTICADMGWKEVR